MVSALSPTKPRDHKFGTLKLPLAEPSWCLKRLRVPPLAQVNRTWSHVQGTPHRGHSLIPPALSWARAPCHTAWRAGRSLPQKKLREKDATTAHSLQAVWQVPLPTTTPEELKNSPLCGVPCMWDHVLFTCQWWDTQPLQTPAWFSQGKLEGPKFVVARLGWAESRHHARLLPQPRPQLHGRVC